MLILITARSESEYAFLTAGSFVCDQGCLLMYAQSSH